MCAYLEGRLAGAAPRQAQAPHATSEGLEGGFTSLLRAGGLALSSESVLWPRIHHQQPEVCSPRGAQLAWAKVSGLQAGGPVGWAL